MTTTQFSAVMIMAGIIVRDSVFHYKVFIKDEDGVALREWEAAKRAATFHALDEQQEGYDAVIRQDLPPGVYNNPSKAVLVLLHHDQGLVACANFPSCSTSKHSRHVLDMERLHIKVEPHAGRCGY
jgi:hypothetical protein